MGTRVGAGDVDVALKLVLASALQLEGLVVDVGVRHFDEGDGPRDAAVVPPVHAQRGDAVDGAGVVDGGHDEVVAVFHDAGDVTVEGGEAAFVIADVLAVDEDGGRIIGGAEVNEDVRVRLWLVREIPFVPEQALVIEERIFLGVPIPGDVQRG